MFLFTLMFNYTLTYLDYCFTRVEELQIGFQGVVFLSSLAFFVPYEKLW